MYAVFVSAEAREETKIAYDYYEEQMEGLGEQFLKLLEVSYGKLSIQPELYSYLNNSTILRYRLVDRFPFVVIYRIVEKSVNTVSVRHTSRRPLAAF